MSEKGFVPVPSVLVHAERTCPGRVWKYFLASRCLWRQRICAQNPHEDLAHRSRRSLKRIMRSTSFAARRICHSVNSPRGEKNIPNQQLLLSQEASKGKAAAYLLEGWPS